MGRTIALPMVEVRAVRVAEPCPMDWRQLPGDGRVRHCGQCGLDVTNLSAMTGAEAAAFLAAPAVGGRRCVAYEPAADGGPKTIDYRRTDPTRRRVGWRAVTALSAIVAMAIGCARYALGRGATPAVPMGPAMLAGAVATPQPMVLGDVAEPAARPMVAGDVNVGQPTIRPAAGRDERTPAESR